MCDMASSDSDCLGNRGGPTKLQDWVTIIVWYLPCRNRPKKKEKSPKICIWTDLWDTAVNTGGSTWIKGNKRIMTNNSAIHQQSLCPCYVASLEASPLFATHSRSPDMTWAIWQLFKTLCWLLRLCQLPVLQAGPWLIPTESIARGPGLWN